MPYMLRFHDTDDTTEMPDPALVGHAAAWAAERGYWDVATCLMELAHALAEAEVPTPAEAEALEVRTSALTRLLDPVRGTCASCGGPYELRAEGPTRLVHLDLAANHEPVAPDPRYVNQDAPHPESRLTKALERARAEDATGRFCSHGYLVSIAGQHIATGGACSDVQPPPCSGHEKNDLSCSLCGAQRRAFYDALHQQLSSDARELPHPNRATCSHGYAVDQGVAGEPLHIATGGVCTGHIILDARE